MNLTVTTWKHNIYLHREDFGYLYSMYNSNTNGLLAIKLSPFLEKDLWDPNR